MTQLTAAEAAHPPLRTGPLRNGNPRGNPNLASRCGAKSRTTGCPCRAPAMPNGRCRLHGGKSTGPRTEAGLAALARAHTKHGDFTAAARADRRYLRTVINRNHVLAAALQLHPYLPADIRTRFDLGADELAAPPYPLHPVDLPTVLSPQPDAAHPQSAPLVGQPAQEAAQGTAFGVAAKAAQQPTQTPIQTSADGPTQAPTQPRDARGRFAAPPRPLPSGTKAEREAARAERAMLAPWRAGIKRARMVRRLLTLQAQNASRAQQAQHVPLSLPQPAGPAAAPQHAAIAPASSAVAAGLHRYAPLALSERFALARRNAIHRETASHRASRGEDPVKTFMQRDTVGPPAATGVEASVKTPMQRGTVAGHAGPPETIGEPPCPQATYRLPPATRSADATPSPAAASTREATVKTLMHRGTVPWSMNPCRTALLASTAGGDPAARALAAEVEHFGGWPVLIAIEAAKQAGRDWHSVLAATQRHLDNGRARTAALYDPDLRAACLARLDRTPDGA